MEPQFKAGAKVRTRAQNANGHTRLPAYLQNKRAIVLRHVGSFLLPDEAAIEPMRAQRSALYTLEFDAREVWGDPAMTGHICADIFEEYLEPGE